MTTMALLALSAACCFLCAPMAMGQTYYVDFAGGSDAAPGTSAETPFKHSPGDEQATGRAKAVVPVPGDTLLFKGGVYYRGTIVLAWGGEEGKPLTLDGNTAGAFGQGRAIIDGSDPLLGWKPCASADEAGGNEHWRHILRAPAPKGTAPLSWNLCEGDELLYLAQYPKPKDPFWADDVECFFKIPSSACTLTSIVDPRLEELGGKSLVGSFLLFYGKPNWLSPCEITGYDPAARKVSFAKGDKVTGLYPETKYALLNHVRLMERPGEYCFDDKAGHVYVWPQTESGLEKKLFTLSTRQIGLDLGSKSHVVVQGFKIQKQCAGVGQSGGTAIKSAGPATHVVIRDNEITMVRSLPRQGFIWLNKCTHSLIEKNRLYKNPYFRVMILDGLDDSVVRDNYLDKNGGSGIVCFRTHRTKIIGNTIREHIAVHAQGMAIYAHCSDMLIEGNTCMDCSALTMEEGENFTVRHNVFHAGGRLAVGLWGGAPLKNVAILNNVIIGSSNGPDWSKDISIFSNNREMEFSVVVKNNIVDGVEFEGAKGEIAVANNIFTRQYKFKSPNFTDLVETDLQRLFVDPEKHDYRLRAGSPAIDAGADVSTLYPKPAFPDVDFGKDRAGRPRVAGKAVDIGAYEFAPEK